MIDGDEVRRLRAACSTQNQQVCDILGRALGYPWLKDDQANFPGATEADGICVGDHVAESLAAEAAAALSEARARIAELEAAIRNLGAEWLEWDKNQRTHTGSWPRDRFESHLEFALELVEVPKP